MKRRATLLRREAAPKRDAAGDRRGDRPPPPEPDDELSQSDREGPDPVERFAQDGFGALERFGAELEALFMGPPPRRPAPNATAEPQASPAAAAPASTASSSSLSETEAELNRLLMEQGIVVRGHDIARVVSLMSGKSVVWAE
jgi:hypothetical protein